MSMTHNKAPDRVKYGENDPRSGAYETKPAYTLTICFDRLLEYFLKSNELLVYSIGIRFIPGQEVIIFAHLRLSWSSLRGPCSGNEGP